MSKRSILIIATALVAALSFVSMAGALTPGGRSATAGTGTPTATPCPTPKVPDTYHGSGCGTPTPSPTSVRLPPMLTIDFTANGEHDEITVNRGQLVTLTLTYHNDDHRGITIDDTIEWSGSGLGWGHCYISPGSSCSGSIIVSADNVGTMTATARITASVETCGLCPMLSLERTVTIYVVALMGDFNCNGSVNSIDATLILQLAAGLIHPFDCARAGDGNQDGPTAAIAAPLILQYEAGLLTSLPP